MAPRVSSSTRGPATLSSTSIGMPMSAITMSPARSSPGGSTSGSLGAAIVIVNPASIDGPIGSAESADNPDGRSIETTGMPDVLTSAITDSMKPDTGAFRPVPKIASTISVQSLTSEKCSSHAWLSATSTTVRPRRPRISRLTRASPRTSPTLPIRNTATSTPRCTSVRAITNPSPPLLPRPQSTAPAVVAAPADPRPLPIEQIAVHRLHRGDRLPAGVFHEHERWDADVVGRPAIGFPHLGGSQNVHRDMGTAGNRVQKGKTAHRYFTTLATPLGPLFSSAA